VIICPSNPFVSVDPILAIPGMRDHLQRANVPIVAVSPIIAGAAIKGPTAKMMQELQIPNHAEAVAAHYGSLLSGFVIDRQDAHLAAQVQALGIDTVVAQTIMITLADRVDLAQNVLRFIKRSG